MRINPIFIICAIMLLNLNFAVPVVKNTEGWQITKKDGFTGLYGYSLTGDQVCWKVPKEVKDGDIAKIKEKSKLSDSDVAKELAKANKQELKSALYGTVLQTVDLTKDGCMMLYPSVGKYKFGTATVEFTYGNISVSVDMLENTDQCLVGPCHTDYQVCSDGIITPETLDAIFIGTVYDYSVLQYRNYTYNSTYSTVSYFNSTLGNGTIVLNSTTALHTEQKTGWDYFAPEDYTGCSRIRVEGTKAAHENVDNILSVYGIIFPEWAWWNTTWSYSVPCTVTTGVASSLTNFPAYCMIDSQAAIGAGKMNVSGWDIRVLNNANTTELLFEIEGGTINTNRTVIWIGINTTGGGSDRVFIYYGNPLATSSTQNPQLLWRTADYTHVYHGGQNGTLTNSAGYNNISSSNNASCVSSFGNGTIGMGWTSIADATSCFWNNAGTATAYPTGDGDGTESIWFKYGGNFTGVAPALYTYGQYASYKSRGLSWYPAGTSLRYETYTNFATVAGWSFPTNTFQHYATKYDTSNNTAYIYRNGTIIGQGGGPGLSTTANLEVVVGQGEGLKSNWGYITGEYDEYRITNISRTNDWILAEYSQSYSVGAEIVYVANSPPTLNSIILSPAVLYKNTTAYCAVNYTDDLNTTFSVYQGLTVNGTRVDVFNTTNAAYSNGSVWNASYSIINYTHGDKIACWSFAVDTDASPQTSATNYTANITMSNYYPVISNVQLTSPIQNGSNATGSATFTDYENDTIACTWIWYRNGTHIFNVSQSPCLNSSTISYLKYSISDLINFTVNASDSFGGFSNLSYSATEEVLPPFKVNSYNYTTPTAETFPYNYTINFTVPAGNYLNYAYFNINGVNITGTTCTNVSTTYYCYINGIPTPLTATNGTSRMAYWLMNYTDGATSIEANQTFNYTTLFGMWPGGYIYSPPTVIGGQNTNMNFTYGYTTGILGTISGTGLFNGQTATATCSGGLCNASIPTSTTSSTNVYQTFANLTLTSSYWGTSVTRVANATADYTSTALNATMTYHSTITNPNNANDSNWGTYANMFNTAHWMVFNYTYSELYQFGVWNVKDVGGTHSYTMPQDCWRQNVSLKVSRLTTQLNYTCLNYSSGEYVQIGLVTPGVNYYFYESNLTFFKNNSWSRLLPFGLTDCTTGTPFLNYTAYDETTGGSLTLDYSITYTLQSVSGTTYQTFSGAGVSAWNICFYPDDLVANISSIEEYSATNYDTRFYYLFGVSTGANTSYALDRFLGPDTTTKLTFIYVKRAGVGEPNVYIYVQRLFVENNTFKTVGMGKTNGDGAAVVYLEPNDAFYRFLVYDADGETILYTSSTQQVGCAASAASCAVTLNIETSVVDFWDYQDGMATACTFDNTTKIISCSFLVLDGTAHNFVLDVYRWSQFGNKTLNCTASTTSSSGVLWCDMGDATTTGQFVYYLQSYSTGLILEEGTVNWAAVAAWGAAGLFIAFLLIIVLGWIGTNFGPSMTIIMCYVGFVVSWLFQFVNVDLTGIVGLGAVAGALVYVIKH